MLSRMKFDIDDIVTKKLDALPKTIWTSKTTRFLDPAIGGGQYVRAIEQRLRDAGHSTANIRSRVFGYEQSSLYIRFAVNKYNLVGQYVEMPYDEFFELDTTNMKKFDVVVGNPPYQTHTDNNSRAIWPAFVQKAVELATPDGYVALIHPSGWRNVRGKYDIIKDLYTTKTLNYLSIHNVQDGRKTFGASTRYDVCIAQNTDSTSKHRTAVRFEDNVTQQVNLKKLPFIPNCNLKDVMKVVAKVGEVPVEVLHSESAYVPRAKWVSKIKSNNPLIYGVRTLSKHSEPVLLWSSRNDRGHFGIPKLIWSESGDILSAGSIVDAEGKYGLTQFAYAIVDTPKNLPLIKKAFDSKEFRNIMLGCTAGTMIINHKIIATFRKDFWKDFV